MQQSQTHHQIIIKHKESKWHHQTHNIVKVNVKEAEFKFVITFPQFWKSNGKIIISSFMSGLLVCLFVISLFLLSSQNHEHLYQ